MARFARARNPHLTVGYKAVFVRDFRFEVFYNKATSRTLEKVLLAVL